MKIPSLSMPQTPKKKLSSISSEKFSKNSLLNSIDIPIVLVSSLIAEGSFYRIYLTKQKSVLRISKIRLTSMNEVRILCCLTHDSINRMINWFVKDSYLHFEMERCDFNLKERENRIEKFLHKNENENKKRKGGVDARDGVDAREEEDKKKEDLKDYEKEDLKNDEKEDLKSDESAKYKDSNIIISSSSSSSSVNGSLSNNCKTTVNGKSFGSSNDNSSLSSLNSSSLSLITSSSNNSANNSFGSVRKKAKIVKIKVSFENCLDGVMLSDGVRSFSVNSIFPLTFVTSDFVCNNKQNELFDPFSESYVNPGKTLEGINNNDSEVTIKDSEVTIKDSDLYISKDTDLYISKDTDVSIKNTSLVFSKDIAPAFSKDTSPLFSNLLLDDCSISNWINLMMFQISSALSYVHSMKIVHMDVKPENILIKMNRNRKKTLNRSNTVQFFLCDFNISKFGEGSFDLDGDKMYMAPEVLNNCCYYKSDVYALGLIYLELVNKKKLPKSNESYGKLRNNDFTEWKVNEIIKSMLEKDPNKRISAEGVREYFKQRVFE